MATILLVEADSLIVWRLRRQLTGLGHTVPAPAGSAAEGLAAVQAQQPAVVCMDIYGSDTWERVAAGTPVIYLSHASRVRLTRDHRGTVPRFDRAKPFAPEAMVRTLACVFQYGRLQRTLHALAERVTESRRQATALQAQAKDLRQQAAERR